MILVSEFLRVAYSILWLAQGNLEIAEVQRVFAALYPQEEQICLFFVTDLEYKTMQNSSFTWICPKCEFFNFSDSFFSEQLNLVDQNRYSSLAKDGETRTSSTGTKITILSVD